jgi:hypothetical protein
MHFAKLNGPGEHINQPFSLIDTIETNEVKQHAEGQ